MTLAMTINITIKLFAIYQEAYGVPELTLELPPQTPINAVLDQMIALHPTLRPWQEVTRFGVNYQFVEGDTLLQDGDELVLIPPVSGG
jgi:molybdopterin synthase sulfur carrier subunit